MRLEICPNCGTNDDHQTSCCRILYESHRGPHFEKVEDVHAKTVVKLLDKGVDLIHEVLRDCGGVNEEMRIRLAKWRDDANGMIP